MENQTLHQPLTTQQEDRCPELQAIVEVINLYIDGIKNHNADSLREAFHPQSAFFGWNGLAEALYETTSQVLIDHIAATPAPEHTDKPTSCIITSIRVNGKAASVELVMDNYQGCNYEDYFHLLKINGRWWIVSKTFNGDPVVK